MSIENRSPIRPPVQPAVQPATQHPAAQPPVQSRSKFYRRSIDVIYAFIIGQSFLQLDQFITPFSEIFPNAILLLGIGLVYFIIISGWDGYHKSIKLLEHRGKSGTVRYGIDLVITLIVYNLLLVSNPKGSTMYWEIFFYLLPILFTLYLVWDGFKFYEYREKFPEYKPNIPLKGFFVTLSFGLATFIISATYFYFINSQPWERDLLFNRTSIDIAFIVVYIAHTFGYRFVKRFLTE